MKIEFQNSIVRLRFLCGITDIKIAWINPWNGVNKSTDFIDQFQTDLSDNFYKHLSGQNC